MATPEPSEAAVAPEAPAEDASAPSPPSKPPRSPLLALTTALAVLFGITTVVLAFTAASLKSDKDELTSGAAASGQDELIAAAAQFTQAFVDRGTTIESLRDDVLPLSTDAFAEQFSDGIQAVVDLDTAVGLVATQATISDVFVTASDGPTAQAIVIYDARSSFADGRVVENQNQYMVLRLIDIDGSWLVDNANDLLRVLANANVGGVATTSTTAPAG
jgi:hypothetical protein